eukprot:c13497_g1_i1.p1 GENE.c13497_g1_i1~~c13497_g1_i1.p1  ORF type:complete len:440 (+),score=131.15 c13497_g1_i1:38-1321(+)
MADKETDLRGALLSEVDPVHPHNHPHNQPIIDPEAVEPRQTSHSLQHHEAVYRSCIFVVIPLFMGYAALFSLQGRVRNKFDEDHMPMGKNKFENLFQGAAACLYFGNFCLRLGHNIVFAWMPPRMRVHASQLAMILSMVILMVLSFTTKNASLQADSLWVVFLSYFLGGVSIGSFEANILNVIVPLGHTTKLWAIAGMPIGIISVTVGGFLVLQLDNDNTTPIYATVVVMLVGSFLLFMFHIPSPAVPRKSLTLAHFRADLANWREWLPLIPLPTGSMAFNMFGVACAIPVAGYIYTKNKHVNLKPFGHVPSDIFMVMYNFSFSSADLVSRKVFHPQNGLIRRQINPFYFLTFTGLGMACILSHVPLLACLGGFFIAWANGSIYTQASYFIDVTVPSRYNLTALSMWLFLGDMGSVIGTLMIKKLTD